MSDGCRALGDELREGVGVDLIGGGLSVFGGGGGLAQHEMGPLQGLSVDPRYRRQGSNLDGRVTLHAPVGREVARYLQYLSFFAF